MDEPFASADIPKIIADITSGDRIRALIAIRDKLAFDLQWADARCSPSVAARLAAVLADLDAITGGGRVDAVDEVKQRRDARRAAADAAGF